MSEYINERTSDITEMTALAGETREKDAPFLLWHFVVYETIK